MTDYVLEILDGDKAGDIFELTKTPITIGRRKGNDVIINDEKVSGRHAEIVREDDQFLLKDLNSTNGTLMDGRPITEVVLSPNDVVRVGRIRVAFKEKGAPTPGGEDMRVRKLDAATLAKTRRRGAGISLLLVLVVALAAFGVWYARAGIADPAQVASPKRIVRLPGNLLPEGVDNVEGAARHESDGDQGGWDRAVSGIEFETAGPAHTGRLALVATYPVPEARETGSGGPGHALARTTRALNVVSGQSLVVGAFLATTGGAKVALRLRFTSSAPEDDLVLTAGTRPAAYHGYTRVEHELAVPPDLDQVQVEVLALLPDRDAEARADDFFLLQRGSAEPHELRTSNGFRLLGSDGAVALRAPTAGFVLTRIAPAAPGPALASLDRDGLLLLADAGAELRLGGSPQGGARGYSIEVAGVDGVRLDFRGDMGVAGVLARNGKAPFASYADKFRVDEVDEVLLGRAESRLLLVLPKPGVVSGERAAGRYRLTFPGTTGFQLVTSFGEESQLARSAVARAERFRQRQDYDQALTSLNKVLEQFPHDLREATRARHLRAELRNEQNAWMDRLQKALDDARFFGTRGGFVAVQEELEALHDKFGAAHLAQRERFLKMQQDVRDQLRQLDRERGVQERARLETLLAVFEASGQKQLKALIQGYIREHLPPEKSANPENPQNNDKEGR